MIKAIDFHCHLDLYPDFEKIIQKCEDDKIITLAVTTTPRAWKKNFELMNSCKFVRPALGLHPQLIKEFSGEIELLISLIPECKYIGEIGIDGSQPYRDSMVLQKTIFNRILDESRKNGGRIFSIHSRNAASDVLDCIENNLEAGKFVLHWFSGTKREVERAITLGCWFSVGPAMLDTKKGLELAKLIPKEKLLTETDGPFAMLKKESLKPGEVKFAEEIIGGMWKKNRIETLNILIENLNSLLK